MTIEEIRKNAPDGATHYAPKNILAKYYRDAGIFGIQMYYAGLWHSSCVTDINELQPLH